MTNKENIKEDYLKFIENSWTWEKLTKEERQRFFLVVKKTKIFGTYEQRKEILQSIYLAFLYGLDYSPICWREKKLRRFKKMSKIKQLKEQQQQAKASYNFKALREINEQIFKEREARRKQARKEREARRDQTLNLKICEICEVLE